MKRQYESGSTKRKIKKAKIAAATAGNQTITQHFKKKEDVAIVAIPNPKDDDAKDKTPETGVNNVPIIEPPSPKPKSEFDPSAEFPTDRGLFEDTIEDCDLKELILKHGPCKPQESPDFNQKHYYCYTKGNLKLPRLWLCFSPTLKKPYCESCWLFADRSDPNLQWSWINGVSGLKEYYGQKIKLHEKCNTHLSAMVVYNQWKKGNRVDKNAEHEIRKEENFWYQVIHRIISIILTLACANLALRGHVEMVAEGICEGGNFLAIVNLMARYDHTLKDLIQLPAHTTKYLSPTVQNEVIQLLGTTVKSSLVKQIRNAPFFSIILDTTSDITRMDQLSIVIRWVKPRE